METISEVMVISDSGSKSNFSIYDMKTGTSIVTFKEGNSGPNGLSLIGGEYFLSASKDTPIINAWTASKQQCEKCTMVAPGIVQCLAVNDLGDYCVAGVKNAMYLWEVSSGRLMNVLEFHSQPITCLKFSSDGTFIISGGEDGLVLVWMFSVIIDGTAGYDTIKPHYVWMGHSADVTDIHVGKMGTYARVATVSRDRTCKIYELESGKLLTTICTDSELTAVTMDNAEYFLMLGCLDGNIYRINLFTSRDGEVQHIGADSKSVFIGHSAPITSLSISTFGRYLLSGSEDGCAILWNILNFANLKKLELEGPITNAFITLLPPGLKNDGNYIPKIPVCTLRRSYDDEPALHIMSRVTNKTLSLTHTETPDKYFGNSILMNAKDKQTMLKNSKASAQELHAVNKQIYSYALRDVVKLLPSTEAE